MNDARVLRWAILGTGFISNAVIEAIALSPGSEVSVIVGRNDVALREFSERHHIPRYDTDFGSVLSDESIDVVYIGLPNHTHAQFTIEAAEHGKAVLSEKSLTTTMADARSLVESVQSNETFFVEGLMYLAHPLYTRLTEILTDGRLGDLRSVRGSYGANISHLVNPAGKGTLFNLGCYPVSLLHLVVQTMCGREAFADRQIAAVGNVSAADNNVVDAALSLRFGNGVLATVQSSDNFGNDSEFAISGEHGTLRFVTNPWLPVAGSNVLSWEPFDGPSETIVVDTPQDAFFHQIQMVERHLAAGHSEAARPSPRLTDSLEIMELLTDWETTVLL